MAYCTQADVQAAAGGEKSLREIADLDRNGVADSDMISRVIASADAWVNGELAKRLSVPLSEPIPQRVKDIAADEAVYLLKRRRTMASEDDRADHSERKQELQDIAKGLSTVGTDPQPSKASSRIDKYGTRSSDLAVGRKNLEGYS